MDLDLRKEKCMEDENTDISPLGIKPDFLVIPKRNADLAEAIIRRSEYESRILMDIKGFELMKRWALEIAGNCDTQIRILNECKDTMAM